MNQEYEIILRNEMNGKEYEKKLINNIPIKYKKYISSQWRYF